MHASGHIHLLTCICTHAGGRLISVSSRAHEAKALRRCSVATKRRQQQQQRLGQRQQPSSCKSGSSFAVSSSCVREATLLRALERNAVDAIHTYTPIWRGMRYMMYTCSVLIRYIIISLYVVAVLYGHRRKCRLSEVSQHMYTARSMSSVLVTVKLQGIIHKNALLLLRSEQGQ